jgi:hypothetical protein
MPKCSNTYLICSNSNCPKRHTTTLHYCQEEGGRQVYQCSICGVKKVKRLSMRSGTPPQEDSSEFGS